jgi:nitroreductase/FMN reductase [NAD(P)H]
VKQYGKPEVYGWSDDKARQYSRPERADFGAFIREKRFNLS